VSLLQPSEVCANLLSHETASPEAAQPAAPRQAIVANAPFTQMRAVFASTHAIWSGLHLSPTFFLQAARMPHAKTRRTSARRIDLLSYPLRALGSSSEMLQGEHRTRGFARPGEVDLPSEVPLRRLFVLGQERLGDLPDPVFYLDPEVLGGA